MLSTSLKKKLNKFLMPPQQVLNGFGKHCKKDFNEDMSAGQIAANALLGLIPIVDQVLDCRDLVANCNKIHDDPEDSWAWIALVLTLIGCITLGSAVKGVVKIIFLFARKSAVI